MRNAWIDATADRTVRGTEIATAEVPAPAATVRAAGASDGAVAAVEVAAVGSSSG